MATIVQLNTRIANKHVGVINNPNNSFYDPLTGVNLNPGNLTSGDISSFSNAQLVNIATAVNKGILTLVSGSLPADEYSYTTYSLFATGGDPTLPTGGGVTGVGQAEY